MIDRLPVRNVRSCLRRRGASCAQVISNDPTAGDDHRQRLLRIRQRGKVIEWVDVRDQQVREGTRDHATDLTLEIA